MHPYLIRNPIGGKVMKTKDIILVGLFAALTAIGAFIKIPIPYVSFTLQFLFCAYAGILLGARLGALSQIVYVAIGLIGLPIFTEGGGPGYVLKPTFGYLIGFIVSAYVIGKITERINKINFASLLSAVTAGLIVLYVIGVVYLFMIMNLYLHLNKSFLWAVINGCFLFIGKDFVLSVMIALSGVKIIPILKKYN